MGYHAERFPVKFGKTSDPSLVDFTLPEDSAFSILSPHQAIAQNPRISIGYPKWDPKQLTGFYPENPGDPLTYYASRLNAIEFNATFYREYAPEQFAKWAEHTPEGFRFYPKIPQSISRYRRLVDVGDRVAHFLKGLDALGTKLGMAFLQMDATFGPRHFPDLAAFIVTWPSAFPLALELRNRDWYGDRAVVAELYELLTNNGVTYILTDTHTRRDMLHMQLPTKEAFIRFVDTDHHVDFERLDAWVARLKDWTKRGLKGIHFFVHRKEVRDSPFLVEYLSRQLESIIRRA